MNDDQYIKSQLANCNVCKMIAELNETDYYSSFTFERFGY
jgi:hypothetical protein